MTTSRVFFPLLSSCWGDHNGRHPLWDGGASSPRGILIASFIEDEGFELLITGNATHFHSQTGTSTSIALSVCTSNSLLDFTWRVLPGLYGSDNFPILLESVDSDPRSRPPRWRLDRLDWQCFTDLTSSVRSLADFGTCNDAAIYFTDVLHSVALLSVPKTSGRFSKRPVPWWNADCTTPVREKWSAFSRLCHHRGDLLCLEAFRRARARARHILKEAQ